jgi:hypothetical protein
MRCIGCRARFETRPGRTGSLLSKRRAEKRSAFRLNRHRWRFLSSGAGVSGKEVGPEGANPSQCEFPRRRKAKWRNALRISALRF